MCRGSWDAGGIDEVVMRRGGGGEEVGGGVKEV